MGFSHDFMKFLENMSEDDIKRYTAPTGVVWALDIIEKWAVQPTSTYFKKIFTFMTLFAVPIFALGAYTDRLDEPNTMRAVAGAGIIGFFACHVPIIVATIIASPVYIRPIRAFLRHRAKTNRIAKETEMNDRAKSERDDAFWASPEGQRVRAAEMLAQIEAEKDERRLVSAAEAAKLRLAEQAKALEMARQVAEEEEARKESEFDRLKEL